MPRCQDVHQTMVRQVQLTGHTSFNFPPGSRNVCAKPPDLFYVFHISRKKNIGPQPVNASLLLRTVFIPGPGAHLPGAVFPSSLLQNGVRSDIMSESLILKSDPMKVFLNASFYVAFSELAERRWCLMTALTGAGFVSEHMLSGPFVELGVGSRSSKRCRFTAV